MDLRDIVDLVNLVSSRDIAELEVERDGVRVRIVKGTRQAAGERADQALALQVPAAAIAVERVGPGAPAALAASAPGPALAGSTAGAAAGAPSAPSAGPVAGEPAASAEEDLYVMRAPIVGTFYRSPSPSAEAYVQTGDRVKKGQVICIVEAMKLMNEIESEVAGVVVEALVEDGQPVEYGEPLFRIRPER